MHPTLRPATRALIVATLGGIILWTAIIAALLCIVSPTLARADVAHLPAQGGVVCTGDVGCLTPIGARAVALSDATHRPTFARTLRPGRTLTRTRQCAQGGYFADVNAYRANGGALGAQMTNEDGTILAWLARDGRAVTFDGITWQNRTLRSVIVAGWCE
jgi:hypothetical protein